jgi:hypothetical protein
MPGTNVATDTVTTTAGTTRAVDDNASEILEQRRASERYFMNNFYEEWTEVYRNMKCRVEPLVRKNDQGQEVEDHDRSNVCLPDHHMMVRRGTARLTRNMPNLRLRGKDQQKANLTAAQLMYQWDRSESQRSFRRIVRCTKALGIGWGKSYYDKVQVTRRFRRVTQRLTREELMQHQGAPQDEIDDAAGQNGNQLSEAEISQAVSEYGDAVTLGVNVLKYNGPMLDYVFSGDIFPEPGFYSGAQSAYLIENSIRDEQWLDYWTKQMSEDPDTGEETPVVDPKKAQELMEMAGDRNYLDQKSISLRRMMREAISVADPLSAGKPVKPPRKRFMIDERHSIVNGRLCIEYVGEESLYLGKQWYPWDTYGRYIHTDMVLMPDLFEGVGDSTPRVTRFVMQLRNVRMNQTTDFINNKLVPLLKMLEGSDYTDQDIVRTGFARLLKVKSLAELEFLQDPMMPPEAFQDTAQLIREMQQADPALADFNPGDEAVPQAGKLATSLILQKKAGDDILADELNELGQFIRTVMENWLAFNQQAMEEALEISSEGAPNRLKQVIEALSTRTQGGNPRTIKIDPQDIQEEYEILPEEGSTLADDDEYRLQKIQQGFMLSLQCPTILNPRAFAAALVQAIPGISPEEAIMPPPPPPPPTQPPKVSFNIAAKFEDLAPDVQEAILSGVNLPSHGTATLGLVHHGAKAIESVARAANAASELEKPAQEPPDAESPGMKAVETKVGQ